VFHYGHARSLEQAKKLFPNAHLVVGVCSDADTHRIKGLTVMDEKQRAESVKHCRWVDEVVENSPWVLSPRFIIEHHIDYIAHGEDISVDEDGNDAYAWQKRGGLYRVIKRTQGISTSDIILKILRNKDDYVQRNLKRGYTPTDLNLGYLETAKYRVQSAGTYVAQGVGYALRPVTGLFGYLVTPSAPAITAPSAPPAQPASSSAKEKKPGDKTAADASSANKSPAETSAGAAAAAK